MEAGAATGYEPHSELRVSVTVGAGARVLHWQIGLGEMRTKEPSSDEYSPHFRPSTKYFLNQKSRKTY